MKRSGADAVLTRVTRQALAVAAIGVLVLGAAPGQVRSAGCSAPLFAYRTGAVFFDEGGRVTRVRVQIADTPDRQEVGLMCRNTLDPDAGMLFMFPATMEGAFWMKNTLIPLAIAFIDANWHIVRIMEMPVAADPTADDPSKFPLYDPHRPYRYALEVNAGFFAKHEVSERAGVRFVPQEGAFRSAAPATAARP